MIRKKCSNCERKFKKVEFILENVFPNPKEGISSKKDRVIPGFSGQLFLMMSKGNSTLRNKNHWILKDFLFDFYRKFSKTYYTLNKHEVFV